MTRTTTTDRGQATIEFALAIPIVAVMALGIVQVALVARDQLAVEHAARVATRAAAVAADPGSAARQAAHSAVSLEPLTVDTQVTGDLVTVSVSYDHPTDVPLIGSLIPDARLAASVTMHREPP